MRPKGEIRIALLSAAVRLAQEKGGATYRELARCAELEVLDPTSFEGRQIQRGVPAKLARRTVENMVRARELAIVGREKPAGCSQWMALYAPAQERFGVEPASDPAAPLCEVLRGWVDGR